MKRIVVAGVLLVAVVVAVAGYFGTRPSTASSSARGYLMAPLDARPAPARPLTVFEARVPPLGVRHVYSSGVYPQVRGSGVDLTAVNSALREAVLADERSFRPYAKRDRAELEGQRPKTVYFSSRGRYLMWIDRKLVSASTVVVSALLPATGETFEGQEGGDSWLPMTILVPSGRRVTLTALFRNVNQALLVLQRAWKTHPGIAGRCARTYWEIFTPRVENYRAFALTPTGLALGSTETGACYRFVIIVPYRAVQPDLGNLGKRLVNAVRKPDRLVGACFRRPPQQNAPGSWGHRLRCAH